MITTSKDDNAEYVSSGMYYLFQDSSDKSAMHFLQ